MKLGLALCLCATCLTAHNVLANYRAGASSAAVADSLSGLTVSEDLAAGALISPDTPMPVEMVDGWAYIGVLRVPSLGLELPVMNEWSYAGLRLAPCRYAGSAYSDDMVVAAHNYARHFGNLRSLSYGDEVSFTDVRGNVFLYQVESIEQLRPSDVEEMVESDWDLTLFTCTLGGANRVTVRCSAVDLSSLVYDSSGD